MTENTLVLCQSCLDDIETDLLPRELAAGGGDGEAVSGDAFGEERDELDRMISRGKADARKLAHARVLLQADASEAGPGWADAAIAETLRMSVRTIERVRQRFVEDGLSAALLPSPLGDPTAKQPVAKPPEGPSTRVYARKLDGVQEARLIALACSGPPEGKKRWTLRLLAEQMVALEIVPELSHETVRQVLGEKCPQAAPAADGGHSVARQSG